MATTDELLAALMRDCRKPENLIGENGLLKRLFNPPPERVIPAETSREAITRGCTGRKP